ncbi:SRPBCC family protein [Nocardiopsis changdeensis]|uniref:SRPBCC family protein n=1 Tax=Nocardiopsis changdeensis TaxID=2831969 RepID=UPI003F46B3C5
MRFEKSVEIQAPRQRVWDVLSDIEAWPRVVRLVEVAEIVSPPPLARGGTVRLREHRLPEGLWDVTSWNAPVSFELTQRAGGVTTVARHRVDALGADRSRLTLDLEMRGLMVSIVGVFFRKSTRNHLDRQAQDLKRAAENTP